MKFKKPCAVALAVLYASTVSPTGVLKDAFTKEVSAETISYCRDGDIQWWVDIINMDDDSVIYDASVNITIKSTDETGTVTVSDAKLSELKQAVQDCVTLYHCSPIVSIIIEDGVTSVPESLKDVLDIEGVNFWYLNFPDTMSFENARTVFGEYYTYTFDTRTVTTGTIMGSDGINVATYTITANNFDVKNATLKIKIDTGINWDEIGDYFWDYSGISSEYKDKITTIELDSGTTTVPTNLFKDFTALKTLTMNGVTSIGEGDFSKYPNLTTVNLPDVTYIDADAFTNNTKLTTVSLPSIETIDSGVFSGCTSLKTVTLSSKLTSIGGEAFTGCTSLSNVSYDGTAGIPSTTELGNGAFYGCTSLFSVAHELEEGQLGESAIYYTLEVTDGTTGAVKLTLNGTGDMPDYTADSLAPWSKYKDKLTEVELKNSDDYSSSHISKIGNYAFYGCSALQSLTAIGYYYMDAEYMGAFISVGDYAFADCSSLTGLKCRASSDYSSSQLFVSSVGERAFQNCKSLNANKFLINGTIGAYAFEGCTGLKNVYMQGATSIADGVFKDCTSLTTVKSLQYLEAWSYGDEVYVWEEYGDCTLTSIGKEAFYNCTSLTTIPTMQESTTVGEDAFYNCNNLQGLNYTVKSGECGENVTYKVNVTNGAATEMTLTISGTGAMYDYTAADAAPWAEYAQYINKVVIEDGVTTIGSNALSDCTSLASISIPSTVASVTVSDFDAIDLDNLDVTYEVAKGSCGTKANYSLVSHSLDGNNATLTISGSGATSGYALNALPWNSYKSRITSIVVEKGITGIGRYLFAGCSNVTSVTLPTGLTSIGDYAFRSCSSLESVEIPSGVTEISVGMFMNCSALADVTIPDGVEVINSKAFKSCSALTGVTLPDSLYEIGASAFEDCTSLTTINLSNVSTIGENAFLNCPLKNTSFVVTTDDDDNTCGENASFTLTVIDAATNSMRLTVSGTGDMYSYEDSTAPWAKYKSYITEIVVEDGITSVPSKAFGDCSSLTSITLPKLNSRVNAEDFAACPLTEVSILLDKDSCGDDIGYELYATSIDYSDKKLVLSGSGAMTDYDSASDTPWASVAGDITEVTFSDEITGIGDYAFSGFTGLSSVTLPTDIRKLGAHAFDGCTALTAVSGISDRVTVKDTTFDNCENLHISYLLEDGFRGAYLIYEITVTDAAEKTMTLTISGYYRMKDFDSASDTPWAKYADYITKLEFRGLEGNNGVLRYLGTHAFEGLTKLTSVDLPLIDGNSISAYAFAGCTGLTSITYKGDVASIGEGAFKGCTNLSSTFGLENVESLGKSAFEDCTSLSTIELGTKSNMTSVANSAFKGCTALTSVAIPESVEEIGAEAFMNCSSLSSITELDYIHNVVVGKDAFTGTKLQNISYLYEAYTDDNGLTYTAVVKDPVTMDIVLTVSGEGKMDDYTDTSATPWADYSNNIVEVVIEKGVESIGDKAFSACTNLTKISIPSTVASVNKNDFTDALTDVTYVVAEGEFEDDDEANYKLVSKSLDKTEQTLTISGEGEMDDYYGVNGQPWSDNNPYITKIVVEDGVTYIGRYAFAGCTAVTDITIADTVEDIMLYAFENCSSLERVNIPSGVTSIAKGMFKGCDSLSELELGDNVTNIADGAFKDFKGLTKVTLPANLTELKADTFEGCINLKEVKFNDKLKTIGSDAFKECTSLTSIVLPDSVTTVGSSAFDGCTGLTRFIIPETVTNIGSGVLSGCTALTEVRYNHNEGTDEVNLGVSEDIVKSINVIKDNRIEVDLTNPTITDDTVDFDIRVATASFGGEDETAMYLDGVKVVINEQEYSISECYEEDGYIIFPVRVTVTNPDTVSLAIRGQVDAKNAEDEITTVYFASSASTANR